MAYRKQRSNKGRVNNKVILGLLAFLVIAVPVTVITVGQQTNWFNHAAAPSDQAMTNLNSTTDTLSTINPDGTMGPQTSYGNWSNSLPSFLKGKLVFSVIDPKPTDPGSQGKRPTESFHNPSNPSQGSASGKKGKNGPQTVTALNLTVTKVEVHIAYQGKPGDQSDNEGQGGKSSITPSQQGKDVDHWETLSVTTPTTLDLVQLAKTKDVAKLGITDLAEGRYTEIRLYVSGATATLSDGSTVNLTILGKDNIVRVIRPFTIVAGQTTTLTMDFDAQHAVIKAGDRYLLKPVVARLLEAKQ